MTETVYSHLPTLKIIFEAMQNTTANTLTLQKNILCLSPVYYLYTSHNSQTRCIVFNVQLSKAMSHPLKQYLLAILF